MWLRPQSSARRCRAVRAAAVAFIRSILQLVAEDPCLGVDATHGNWRNAPTATGVSGSWMFRSGRYARELAQRTKRNQEGLKGEGSTLTNGSRPLEGCGFFNRRMCADDEPASHCAHQLTAAQSWVGTHSWGRVLRVSRKRVDGGATPRCVRKGRCRARYGGGPSAHLVCDTTKLLHAFNGVELVGDTGAWAARAIGGGGLDHRGGCSLALLTLIPCV
eukprot:655622-Prorocentrum_minimum.AAC.1